VITQKTAVYRKIAELAIKRTIWKVTLDRFNCIYVVPMIGLRRLTIPIVYTKGRNILK
jgi:hypothetical protein